MLPTPTLGHTTSSPPEVEEFIQENGLDEKAAAELRAADLKIQIAVLSLGRINSCTNPSAICVARLRAARRNSNGADPATAMQERSTEISEEVETFLKDNSVDSRAANVLRAQTPEVQRAVLDRGDLADCDNPSTALMGRIKVAIDAINYERTRKRMGSPTGLDVPGLPAQPLNPEVEEFIKENNVDEMAAKQLRMVDRRTQESVLARGSLDRCRNPSAVIGARIREAKEEQLQARREKEERERERERAAAAGAMVGAGSMANPMMAMMGAPTMPVMPMPTPAMMNPMMVNPMMAMMMPMAGAMMMNPMMMNPMMMGAMQPAMMMSMGLQSGMMGGMQTAPACGGAAGAPNAGGAGINVTACSSYGPSASSRPLEGGPRAAPY